ncbi:MAG: hypothetical protein Q4C37_03805 [Bacteroidales bacterium]|nr:hypothetical protein [Bacteroidales bacterium]
MIKRKRGSGGRFAAAPVASADFRRFLFIFILLQKPFPRTSAHIQRILPQAKSSASFHRSKGQEQVAKKIRVNPRLPPAMPKAAGIRVCAKS